MLALPWVYWVIFTARQHPMSDWSGAAAWLHGAMKARQRRRERASEFM